MLDRVFKCVFTHPFSRRENLDKLDLLENLLAKPTVSLLSAFLESGVVHFSVDGLVDLFSVDLNSHIQLENVHKIKVSLASDFSSLQVLVPYTLANSDQVKLTLLGLDLSSLKSSFPEIVRLMTRAAYLREIAVNLRFCYEKMRMSFQDIQRKIKGFLMDLEMEDDPLILLKLKQFISTGNQNEKINDFFKNLSVKKIGEMRETVGSFLKDCRGLLLDTFKAGLSRMLVVLSFLKSARPGLFDPLDSLVRQAFFLVDSIISKSVAKEIQMRNFFIFLYRSKLKTISPKKVCEYEDENLSGERLDHLQLLRLLSSSDSLYLKDFLSLIERSQLTGDFRQTHSPLFKENLDKGFQNQQIEKEFEDLMNDLHLQLDSSNLKQFDHFEGESIPISVRQFALTKGAEELPNVSEDHRQDFDRQSEEHSGFVH